MSAIIGRRAVTSSSISFVSNTQIDAEQRAKETAREEANKAPVSSLAAEVRRQFESAKLARASKTDKILLDCLRARDGEYPPEKLAAIKSTGGSEIYMMLPSIKVRAAIAWVNDIMFGPSDKPYGCEPTKIPELSPEHEQLLAGFVQAEAMAWMQQAQAFLPPQALQERFSQLADQLKKRQVEKAKETAQRMQDKIEDQYQEGHWEAAMKEVISDIMTYPVAILKGPVLRKRRKNVYKQDQFGKWVPNIGERIVPEWYRVSPFDFWFSSSSRHVNDGPIFERHRLRRSELLSFRGVPGYSTASINAALLEYGKQGLRSWLYTDQERAQLEGRPNEMMYQSDTMDVIEAWMPVSGRMLKDWGAEITDTTKEYEANVWLIGNYVIRAVLNPNTLGERPYYTASFEMIPGAPIGKSLIQIMQDCTDMCNAAARSLINNAAMASGPMGEVHTDRLAQGEEVTQAFPWRFIQTLSDPHGTNNPAVRYFQPDMQVDKLLAIYEHFSKVADEVTGIPKFEYGQGAQAGAGGTASGLSMLMSSAARGIKQVVTHVDMIIEGSIKYLYNFNMLNDEDESIKGDLNVMATTSRSLIAKEQQQIRRAEMLRETNNPTDLAIMGMKGRAEMLRSSFKSFEDDPDKIIPDEQTLQLREVQQAQMQQMQAQQAQLQGPKSLNPAGQPVSGQDTALFQ